MSNQFQHHHKFDEIMVFWSYMLLNCTVKHFSSKFWFW